MVKSHVDHIGINDFADHEAFELECQLEFLHMEYTMHAEAIEKHGMKVKEVELGLVDFPAILDGVEVYLCWKLGEGVLATIMEWKKDFSVEEKFRSFYSVSSSSMNQN
ncbi:DUF2203 family protein [Brevibacillus laterosporus]